MNLDNYPYFANNNFLNYEFFSMGPKGKIKKSVRFTQISINDPIIYNLGFGDVVEATDEIDDGAISNNDDRDIILATIANTIIDFTDRYVNHYIFVTGSTPSRTRLYQMVISGRLEEISINYLIFGLKDKLWYAFQKNVYYHAFLVKRK